MIDCIISAKAFEDFVNNDLSHALAQFDHEEAAIYIYCHLTQPTEPSRRVMVVTDANSAKIAVCIEASFELFEGDTHYYARQVGTINRSQAADKLEPLVREAFEIITSWRPTLANLEEDAFLPG